MADIEFEEGNTQGARAVHDAALLIDITRHIEAMVELLCGHVPDGRCQDIARSKLQEAEAWARRAVTHND
jgi:hypothetical protein